MGCCSCTETPSSTMQGEEIVLSPRSRSLPSLKVVSESLLLFEGPISIQQFPAVCNKLALPESLTDRREFCEGLQLVEGEIDPVLLTGACALLSGEPYEDKLDLLLPKYQESPYLVTPDEFVRLLTDLVTVLTRALHPNSGLELSQDNLIKQCLQVIGVRPLSKNELFKRVQASPFLQKAFTSKGLEQALQEQTAQRSTSTLLPCTSTSKLSDSTTPTKGLPESFSKSPERTSIEPVNAANEEIVNEVDVLEDATKKPTVININLGPRKSDQLIIHPGQDPIEVAKTFAAKHRFNAKERKNFLQFVANYGN